MRVEKRLFIQRILILAFWVRTTFGFVSEELLTFIAPLQPYIYLLFDAVIVLLGIMSITKKRDKIFAAIFVAITFFETYAENNLSILFYLNGIRDFLAYIFLIPIFVYLLGDDESRDDIIEKFDKQLFYFVVIQFPCLVFQFILYGAGDHGGGSLGNYSSGIITTLIYVISFYLIQKRLDNRHYLSSLWQNKIYIILLIPTFLNETKISFVFLPLYFILLLPIDKKLFLRLLMTIPILIASLWGAVTAYVMSTGGSMGDVFSIEYYTDMYLYNSESEDYAKWLMDEDMGEMEDVPRMSKLMLLAEINQEHPGHLLFGYGVGHFKGGTVVKDSAFFKEYKWLFTGSIPYAFHVFVQIGIIGIIMMFLYFVFIFIVSPEKGMKRNFNVQIYIILTLLLLLFYNDSIRNAYMMLPIVYVVMASWKLKEEYRGGSEDNGELEMKS